MVLELVEARAVNVADADVIAHARYFQFQLFLYHLLVMELEAILAENLANLPVLGADEIQEAPEVVDLVEQKGTSGSSKKVTFGGDGQLVLSPPSFSSLISSGWRPKLSFHNTINVHLRGSHRVLKKLNLATGQTLTPMGLERVFQKSIRLW